MGDPNQGSIPTATPTECWCLRHCLFAVAAYVAEAAIGRLQCSGAVIDTSLTTRPWNEQLRSAALHSFDVLDTPREEDFDEVARIASDICGTPIAVVNLVDTTRQFFKAEVGLGVRTTPLESAFCAHTLLEDDILIIPDATKDSRLECNPLVTQAPHLRAYAGALLKTSEGLPIGTVCVLDYRPREFSDAQIKMLQFLAKQTMTQLELRKTVVEQRRLLDRARAAEDEKAKFEMLVTQASDFIGMADARGRVVFLNDAARQMMGLGAHENFPDQADEFIAPADRQLFRSVVVPIIRSGESCERELRLRNFRSGDLIPALYTMFPMRGPVGEIVGYGVVTKDITNQKAEEEKRGQIVSEAAHRMKNTLSVVQAIVFQTLKTASTMELGREAIAKRLQALANAQDILTAAEGSAADIVHVVESALMPHDPGNERIRFAGPSRPIDARQALGLSLALHELATNATKYGGLKGETGSVAIDWKIGEDGVFELEWKESGVAVVAPTSTGFGSKLIRNMAAPYFGGTSHLEFEPDGVRFRLTGKL